MRQNDGGPAFPADYLEGNYHETLRIASIGMSLRDYFAAVVLQGIMSRDHYDPGQASPTQRAHLAYVDADAMLAERLK